MKKLLFGLVGLFIASQFIVSCSSDNAMLSQFSKRKYLKKQKAKNVKYEDKVGEVKNDLAYNDVDKEEVIVASTKEEEVVAKKTIVTEEVEVNTIKTTTKRDEKVAAINDYSAWNNYNRTVKMPNFSKEMAVKHHSNQNVSSKRASEILIAILCIFLPPVAVVVYEDSVTTNFWVDLVATLLFWLPGIILAFLICFAGVSF